MIDTDQTGQKKFDELMMNRDSFEWTEFELKFLDDMNEKLMTYGLMTSKQKSLVGRLYDKLMFGG